MSLPIGQRESEVLELKSRDALKKKDYKDLAREVVAFLNTKGGDLYIGIREENGIAVEVESIDSVEEELRQLRSSLLDSIEPDPSPGELDLTALWDEEGRAVLRIAVETGRHGPYALMEQRGARRFMVRMGDDNRPMSREELAARFAEGRPEEDRLVAVRSRLLEERDELLREGEDRIWCAIQPVSELELKTSDSRYAALLSDPEATGTPPEAPSYHVPFEPEVRQDRLVLGVRLPGFGRSLNRNLKETTLFNDGRIRHQAVLHAVYQHATGSAPRIINPEVLIGLPLSLLRLAGQVLAEKLEERDRLVIDLALFGVGRERSVLSPGGWRRPRHGQEVNVYEDGDDLTLTKPPVFPFGEVRDFPERCTFRLMSLIYEAFGLREDAIPRELDSRTGRFKVSA